MNSHSFPAIIFPQLETVIAKPYAGDGATNKQGALMTFSQRAEEKAKDLRAAILKHPFVTGIGDGTLDVEKFKFYVRQDYLYLIDYSRVLALASARAETLDEMSWFARLLHETLNTEMELHRDYCRQFGISRLELEETLPVTHHHCVHPVSPLRS